MWGEHYRLVADTLTHNIILSYLLMASKILSMHHFLFISVSYYTLTVVDNFMYNIRVPSYIVATKFESNQTFSSAILNGT